MTTTGNDKTNVSTAQSENLFSSWQTVQLNFLLAKELAGLHYLWQDLDQGIK